MCLQQNLVVFIGQLSLKCANFERNVDNGCLLFFKKSFRNIRSGQKVNGTRHFGSSQRKISGSNGTSEKAACFSVGNVVNGNSRSCSSKPSLIPVPGLRGHFSQYVKMVNAIPGRILNREENCDVMLPWQQNFWISTIFLDSGGQLHCQMMDEKNRLSCCS